MSLRSRADDVRAVLTEHTEAEGDPDFVALVCNGCGRTIHAAGIQELQTRADSEGWRVSDEFGGFDYCGACSS